MALGDRPLDDAGRDYYARLFDGRIQNLRKPGAAPPSAPRGSRGGAGAGGVIGGGILILFLLFRVCAGIGDFQSSHYGGSTPQYYAPTFPPPVVDPPELPPIEVPAPPAVNGFNPKLPDVPGDGKDPAAIPDLNPPPIGPDDPPDRNEPFPPDRGP